MSLPALAEGKWSRGLWPVLLLPLMLAAGNPRPPRADETVQFLPTVGWRTQHGWEVEIHGVLLEREPRRWSTTTLQALAGASLGPLTEAEEAIFRQRAARLLADHERGERLPLRLGTQRFTSPPTDKDGHFVLRRVLAERDLPAVGGATAPRPTLRVEVDTPSLDARSFFGTIYLVEPQGVSVISDIDDTIKVTEVRDRQAMLRNALCRPYAAVPGMAALYQEWSREPGVAFHYVSAAPGALASDLQSFLHGEGFPAGSMHLRRIRFKDRTLLELFATPDRHKHLEIEALLQRFPERTFVLVGDSGERDPEIYGAIARRHPRQIRRILIRDVTGEPADSARYRQAFADVEPASWEIRNDGAWPGLQGP